MRARRGPDKARCGGAAGRAGRGTGGIRSTGQGGGFAAGRRESGFAAGEAGGAASGRGDPAAMA